MLQKIKHLFAVLLLAGFAAQPALAESFNQEDMAFAFGHSAISNDLGDMALLSNQEMMETEGEVFPLYAIGVFAMHTGRFIATRYVSRSIAANAARSGCNVMCYGSAQQARSLARQAYGRRNVLRHGTSGHRGHVDYSHFQSRLGSPRGHIFYGSRYRR